MSSKKSKNEPQISGESITRWLNPVSIIGVLIFITGMGMLFGAPKYQITLSDNMWYVAVGLACMGAVMWFLGGMPRDEAIEWLKSGGFAIGLALLIRWPIAEPYRIPSGSMEPTLHGDPDIGHGDRVFVNKFIYGVRYPFMDKRIWHGKEPQRFDIVVFRNPEKDAVHKTLVKRIIGMPGERIHIANDKVYVNGEPLALPDFMPRDQKYGVPLGRDPGTYGVRLEDEYSVVPPGHYLMLGDNSYNSRDGRFFGWVPNGNIIGRVASIWWPPQRWRDFTGFSQTLAWKIVLIALGVWAFVRLFIGRSWVALDSDSRVRHYVVSFINIGLRVPFSPWWILRWGKLKRGDMVMYRLDTNDGSTMVLGEVSGLNGEKLEPIGKGKGKAIPDGQIAIAPNDPRRDAYASGLVPLSCVAGLVVAKWWPLT